MLLIQIEAIRTLVGIPYESGENGGLSPIIVLRKMARILIRV